MEKVLLVGVNCNEEDFEESMKELKGLAKANDYKVVGSITQNLKSPTKRFYIGPGKVESVRLMAEEQEASIIIFNHELTPLQYKNLEDEIQKKVMDRTMLILAIFASRARTKEAKLQVEAANLKYMLPRLIMQDANYSQQSGGAMHNKGSGEKQLELDKRILKTRISILEDELDQLEKNKNIQRKKRDKNDIPLVAIVGYTNAGKSTLMNAFLEQYGQENKEKNVLAKDMLFATLDTTIRNIHLPDNKEFLLSDTVGFISHLPTGLVRAFKSTLSEALHADLILNVCDISNPNVLHHIAITQQTLQEIGVKDTPTIYVFNKADKVGLATIPSDDNRVFISAKNGLNINILVNEIKKYIFKDYLTCKMFIPYHDSSVLSYLNDHCNVLSCDYQDEGSMLEVELSKKDFLRLNEYVWVDNKN